MNIKPFQTSLHFTHFYCLAISWTGSMQLIVTQVALIGMKWALWPGKLDMLQKIWRFIDGSCDSINITAVCLPLKWFCSFWDQSKSIVWKLKVNGALICQTIIFTPSSCFFSPHPCMINYQVDIVWSQFHVSTAWLLRWQTQIALGQTDSCCCYSFRWLMH